MKRFANFKSATHVAASLLLSMAVVTLHPRTVLAQRAEPVGIRAQRPVRYDATVATVRSGVAIARDPSFNSPNHPPEIPESRECWGRIVSFAIVGGALGALAGSILGTKVAVTGFIFGGALGAIQAASCPRGRLSSPCC
jgi:hypothetical protein